MHCIRLVSIITVEVVMCMLHRVNVGHVVCVLQVPGVHGCGPGERVPEHSATPYTGDTKNCPHEGTTGAYFYVTYSPKRDYVNDVDTL